MPQHNLKRPCTECPFRKKSLPGWLGPLTVEETMAGADSEHGFACHMDVQKLSQKGVRAESTAALRLVEQCAGAVIYANRSCKSYRGGSLREMQQRLKGSKDEADVMSKMEFRRHHGGE